MDSTIPEGASKNPFHDSVEDYALMDRRYHPSEFVRRGAYTWIQIPEQVKNRITTSINNLQTMLLPTITNLRNQRNISQLQQRIHKKLLVYEEQFNNCHLKCRNISEAYVCGDILGNRLDNQLPKFVKSVLDEY